MEPEEKNSGRRGLSKEEYLKKKKEKKAEEKQNSSKTFKLKSPNIIVSEGSATFDTDKKTLLGKIVVNDDDKSRAGELDIAILPFVETINSKCNYFTTSSCAGRSIVFHKVKEDKYKCDWIYLTHEIECDVNEILTKVNLQITENKLNGETWFKMEPVIVAIQCRDIQSANYLLVLAKFSGLKNCGIRSIANDGSVSVILVDTQHIETLIVSENNLLVDEKYMIIMTNIAKERLIKTRERFEKLRLLLEEQLNKTES